MTDTPQTGVLVDSNVLLDLFTDDPVWAPWSEARLGEAFEAGQVVINPIVYAEISVAFARIETLQATLPHGSHAKTCPGKRRSWPANASSNTAGAAARDGHPYPISTSAPTPPSPAARY